MSTPMRHGPSQQGRTPSQHPAAAPTPQASTPFSNSQTAAAFSPHGPRSSPQQFKKSPATATSATMMGQATNAPVNFDSPSAAAALGALGINDLNLDNMSVGGLVAHPGRTDEEERGKRLDAVIDGLWTRDSGRVSNNGLDKLALLFGLERLWEPGPSGAENDKILVMAGNTIGIEIGINNHVVHSASLSFNDPPPSLDKHVDKASAILLKDLALAPNQSPLTKKLTQFKVNLERLATLEKLSVVPGLNCFEAIAGVWESLEELHRWDIEKLRDDPELAGKPEHVLRVFALCTRHGCPLMHTRGRIGLSLDYWKERRKIPSTTVDREDLRTWAILIECAAPTNTMVYNPIRVSDKWIGPNIEKTDLTDEEMISATGPLLDWLEPPNTLLPASEETKAEGGLENNAALSAPKPPEVVFMATFDPPIIVPQGVSMEIYKISASNPPLSSVTFDALLFPIEDESTYDASEPRELTYTQTVPNLVNIKQGQRDPELKAHKNTLFIDKPVYGQVMTQMPFAHPKDVISMLPTLRQYAFLSLLLDNSFKPKGTPTAPEADVENSKGPNIRTVRDEFSLFMSEANATRSTPSNVLKMDIVLTAHPLPRLQLVFPFKTFTANINLEIQLGGKVHIVSDNIFPTSEEAARANEEAPAGSRGKQYDAKQWAKILEQVEDLGIWVEYIKHKMQ